eukprot:TRINITY_DN1847_c0_g1_i7.p1 TRINITY_DN1847_c0_g1~~TRINITY_DN1847_c0_g1_i7.p1  ORF type:complete len:354 (-),score=76.39 TRINITY_DN1847_c0_g1_i7:1792-2853(-)
MKASENSFENKNLKQNEFRKKGNLIHELFVGDQIYVTSCNRCGEKVENHECFNQITVSIEGTHNLNSCLWRYMKGEELSDYFCDGCNMKQSASRELKLQKLPPILTFHLLRFVYNRETATREKLHNSIHFDENLDMSSFMDSYNPYENTYQLFAVVSHVGFTSFAGHYVAFIYDDQSSCWWKYDDTEVTKCRNPFNYTYLDGDPHPYLLFYKMKSFKQSIPIVIPPFIPGIIPHFLPGIIPHFLELFMELFLIFLELFRIFFLEFFMELFLIFLELFRIFMELFMELFLIFLELFLIFMELFMELFLIFLELFLIFMELFMELFLFFFFHVSFILGNRFPLNWDGVLEKTLTT